MLIIYCYGLFFFCIYKRYYILYSKNSQDISIGYTTKKSDKTTITLQISLVLTS